MNTHTEPVPTIHRPSTVPRSRTLGNLHTPYIHTYHIQRSPDVIGSPVNRARSTLITGQLSSGQQHQQRVPHMRDGRGRRQQVVSRTAQGGQHEETSSKQQRSRPSLLFFLRREGPCVKVLCRRRSLTLSPTSPFYRRWSPQHAARNGRVFRYAGVAARGASATVVASPSAGNATATPGGDTATSRVWPDQWCVL